MRVLMFGWEFPPQVSGGLGSACYGLTRHLALLNVSIKFVVPRINSSMHHFFLEMVDAQKVFFKGENLVEEKIYEKSVHPLISEYVAYETLLTPYLSNESYQKALARLKKASGIDDSTFEKQVSQMELSNTFYGENLLEEVRRFARAGTELGKLNDFDLIHAHDWMGGLAAVMAKRASNRPFIFHVHSTEYDRNFHAPDSKIIEIEKSILEQADRIIAVSERTKRDLISKFGVLAEKIVVVHNAIEKGDTVSFDKKMTPFKDKKIVLFLGRLTAQKGPEYFIDAAVKVIEKIKNVTFVMAGDGDLTPFLKSKVHDLHLDDYFYFTGFLRGAEREKLYSMSDVYVMPSLSEPFGLTPLEAMRYGIPIIVSRQAGVSEVVDELIKVDFSDIDDIAKEILKLLTDSTYQQKLTQNYGKALDKIDWKISASKVLQIYQDFL